MKIRWKYSKDKRWTRWVDIEKTKKFIPEDYWQIIAILDDLKVASRLRNNAFEFLKKKFNWESNLHVLDEIMQDEQAFIQ